jgi:hypothetical protein
MLMACDRLFLCVSERSLLLLRLIPSHAGWSMRVSRGARRTCAITWTRFWHTMSYMTTTSSSTQRYTMGMSWGQFLKLPWEVSGATDFGAVEVATGHSLIQLIAPELVLSRQGGAVVRRERLGGLLSSSHMTDMQGDAQQCFSSIRLFPPSLM